MSPPDAVVGVPPVGQRRHRLRPVLAFLPIFGLHPDKHSQLVQDQIQQMLNVAVPVRPEVSGQMAGRVSDQAADVAPDLVERELPEVLALG